MIRSLLQLLREPALRTRWLLLALAGALAFGVGFVLVSPRTAEPLIVAGGYYYIMAVFGAFVYFFGRVLAARASVWRGWLRRPGWVGFALVVATAVTLWIDPFKHKVLFDEYVLQGTARHMHATKEIGTVIRAYELAGTWVPIDTFLDKRPYFFTFLVSLVHDLTGYRVANIFLVNAALTPVFLGLVYWLGWTLTGRRGPALLAIALLATMPLLAQQASGAGMELHNLTMLVLVMALATLYLRAPDPDRLAALVLGAILLSQSRYESVIFVAPTALVIVLGWQRLQRDGNVSVNSILPWPVLIAPLLLIPYAWHNRILSATPLLWQLHEGQTSRFALSYLPGNLEGAWSFFFNLGPALANSWILSALGVLGFGWFLGRAWRWSRAPQLVSPIVTVMLAFGLFIAGNLAMLMFYYWSRLDDVIASRFALPMCVLLALLAAALVRDLDAPPSRLGRWLAQHRVSFLGLAGTAAAAWFLVFAAPAISRKLYTNQNLVMQELDWEHEMILSRPGPVLLLSNKSSIPFVLWQIPTLINGVGRQRGEQIAYHLHEGTFKEVIVAQALRPTSKDGEMGIDPEDLMPPGFHLEPIAQKRFGGRWARLSRLVSIDPPKSVAQGASSTNGDAAPPPRIQEENTPAGFVGEAESTSLAP